MTHYYSRKYKIKLENWQGAPTPWVLFIGPYKRLKCS
jgi:hypothetical protein